ncbi:hypothetical protein [Arthrobacter zhaoguopingii]|uniref:hypothetical protein n=1 Tax=Arthrobacter zhaoguopingii TaxID=2681491 RepID=UPI001357BA1E|nr:hypothetical protein [Arthrobacter zhaoguopingii]
MTSWSQITAGAVTNETEPPTGFVRAEGNPDFINDFELFDGPTRREPRLRITVSSTWCPQDGIRLWIATPGDALTIEQAMWLSENLPEMLEEIRAAGQTALAAGRVLSSAS